jgi:hypothetical protein
MEGPCPGRGLMLRTEPAPRKCPLQAAGRPFGRDPCQRGCITGFGVVPVNLRLSGSALIKKGSGLGFDGGELSPLAG